MLIRHIRIQNFRGIQSLDWHVEGRVICLVGPGDSTKTTVLDAIELALAPRWYVSVSDADFYNANTSVPIEIEVTIGELPGEILSEERCGLYLRGYRPNEDLLDDPIEGSDRVVCIRLCIADNFEPIWTVNKDDALDPKRLSWRDRERFCISRLGSMTNKELTWGRGSSLSRASTDEATTGPILAQATRAANDSIGTTHSGPLRDVAERARQAATEFGVNLPELNAGLDINALQLGSGAVSLHDSNNIPLRTIGLGSKRLTTLAIQQMGLGRESVILIDEIEYGLEPHRIRRLISKVKSDRSSEVDTNDQHGQVFMTTHSPTAIVGLPVCDLRFVRSNNGITTIDKVQDTIAEDVQRVMRTASLAVLGRKVLVCEGKTEEAMCRSFDESWTSSDAESKSFACFGAVPVNGGGRTHGPRIAREFRRLGHEVAFFGDSDEPLSIDRTTLEGEGVAVFLWQDNFATEQRIANDLQWDYLQEFINTAIRMKGQETILNAVGSRLGENLVAVGPSIDEWRALVTDEETVRRAIGDAAKNTLNGGWFKDLNAGQELGNIVLQALPAIPASDLANVVSSIRDWVRDD